MLWVPELAMVPQRFPAVVETCPAAAVVQCVTRLRSVEALESYVGARSRLIETDKLRTLKHYKKVAEEIRAQAGFAAAAPITTTAGAAPGRPPSRKLDDDADVG